MPASRAAIILAAGQGTRMKSKTVKVLHSVGGRPMLEWTCDLAGQTGAGRSVVVYGAHSPAVRDAAEALGAMTAPNTANAIARTATVKRRNKSR